MKKKIMLALAIIMVLGSVKAMAASEDMSADPDSEYLSINAQGKFPWSESEADAGCSDCLAGSANAGLKSEKDMLKVTIQNQIEQLYMMRDHDYLEVKTASGDTISLGQARSKAVEENEKLKKSFDIKTARLLNKDLSAVLKSVK